MTNPSTNPPPADQAVRDRFIRDLHTSFFLEAGAGSGKTSVIVARVVNLVRHGVPLPQIAAITFTEKAAGELRDRIRAELAATGETVALRQLDAAPIGTIHAFAANILREQAVAAGLDPDFRVLDQLQADLHFARAWQSWLWSSAAPQAALQRGFELGLTARDLQLAAEQLARNRDLTSAYPPLDDGPSAEHLPTEQAQRDAALAELTAALQSFITAEAEQRRRAGALSYDDLLLETRDLLVRSPSARAALRRRYQTVLIDEFQDTDPLQAQIALLLAAEPDTDDWTQATPGPGRLVLAGDPKQSIYRFRRADIDVYEQVRERFAASPETCAIARLRVNFRARPSLCAWQNRVLANVIRPDPHYPRAQARWEPTAPHRQDGGASVAVIPSPRRFARADDARRAEAALLANLITHLHRAASPLGQLPAPDTRAADARRPPQYREIAVLMRARTKAELYTDALDQAGIPYHFDSGQGFYQRPEIRAFAHLLQALDDPADEAAAVAALKSPLAAAADQELFELRAALGNAPFSIDPDQLPPDYAGRLRTPIEQLAQLRGELHGLGLPELIDHVIRASGILPAQAVGARPAQMRQRQANLRMLVQRAAHFAESSGDSLRPFIRWLSQRGLRNLPESESPTTEADDDAVRLLTIHQAKGLEFPVVIVPKLQDQAGGRGRYGPDVIIDRPNQRVEFMLGDERAPFRTPGYPAALRRDYAYADAESRRMLYVAATRARDWLILPSFPADSLAQRESFHTILDEAAHDWRHPPAHTDAPDAPDVIVRPPRAFDAAPSAAAPRRVPPVDELRQAWREQHQQALDGGARAIQALTPSALTHDDQPENPPAADAEPLSSDAINPLDFGAAVHDALEAADFDNREVTRDRTRRLCRRRGLPPEPVIAHVERALRSPLLQRAANADIVHRELPLAAVQREDESTTIIEGVADLVFQEAGVWILVDYKSDAAIPPERRAAYERQVQQYAALLNANGVTVGEAHILQTATGESLPVPLPG